MNAPNRDTAFDSIKFYLTLLVIGGHCLETFNMHTSGATAHIYQFIYLFHMPLFVFISGYFLNPAQDKRKFYTSLLLIFETYILFQTPPFIVEWLKGNFSPSNLLNPAWAMWYLPSLMVWRTVVYHFYPPHTN